MIRIGIYDLNWLVKFVNVWFLFTAEVSFMGTHLFVLANPHSSFFWLSDLKCSNVLVNSNNWNIKKLIDFGWAYKINTPTTAAQLGTPQWRGKYLIFKHYLHSTISNSYSLNSTWIWEWLVQSKSLWYLCFWSFAFRVINRLVCKNILLILTEPLCFFKTAQPPQNGKVTQETINGLKFSDYCSFPEFKKIILECLKETPNGRPTAAQLEKKFKLLLPVDENEVEDDFHIQNV